MFKVAGFVLPVGTFKGHLEELGISPREEENNRLMGRAGAAVSNGSEGGKQGKKECFMRMQCGGGGHKKNVGLEKEKGEKQDRKK